MEQYFRIALWMCLLMGYLQAKPAPPCSIVKGDFRFSRLRGQTIAPDTKMTFTSANWTGQCNFTALTEVYSKELRNITLTPGSGKQAVNYALSALERPCLKQARTDKECNITKTVHATFGGFLDALERFVEKVASQLATTPE